MPKIVVHNAQYPVLPLRDVVLFPHMIATLYVAREKSVKALEEVMSHERKILLITQKDAAQDDPQPSDLYQIGTIGTVLQLLKLPDGTVKVLIEGLVRMRVQSCEEDKGFFQARATIIKDEAGKPEEHEALSRAVVGLFEQYVRVSKKTPSEVLASVNQIDNPSKLADTVAAHITLKLSEKQEILEIASISERLERVYAYIEGAMGIFQVERRIRRRVKKQMEKTQREYYLNEQMKAIQKELGEGEDERDEIADLEERVKKVRLSKEAREKCRLELKKLRSMSPMSAEATVTRSFLDWILTIPWRKLSRLKSDLDSAQTILDRDHYSLDKVKERIIEYLAVQKRVGKIRGQVLCLVGPPGVGKTSLGKSVAEATGRKFVRISLGGVRDEAEIRGHRRTYVGSMPGKIIQGMRKAKTSNPLFLLDEVDKLGHDWRGDPSSALLELLDPEQNSAFQDHYLEVDYDLSNVMFMTTANSLNMSPPLLDRLEVIRLPGYTEEEKTQIALRHLIPKQCAEHGIKENEWSLSRSALMDLIRYYTREAGVRSLEREIATLIRKAVRDISFGKATRVQVTPRSLEKYVGVRKFRHRDADSEDTIGMASGLAWTEVGGELLTIEAVTVPGKGKVSSTGKLGDVMRESIQAAEYYVKSRAPLFGIKPTVFSVRDIHVHVPEGATPKDGPSAGVAMVTSIVSVLTGIAINRKVAMTGEISLRGRVLPIGGLKEKLLAALRAGIETVLIPEDNVKDLSDIPDTVKRKLQILPCRSLEQVLNAALVGALEPIVWGAEEAAAAEEVLLRQRENQGDLRTH